MYWNTKERDGEPGEADRLGRGDRRSGGARGRGVLRAPPPCASEAFFSSIPSLPPFLLFSFAFQISFLLASTTHTMKLDTMEARS
jgi:hypothetical protein